MPPEKVRKPRDRNLQRAARALMIEAKVNYTTALRMIKEERDNAATE